MKYIIRELQNAQSSREGSTVQAASLASAKRVASGRQMFAGTVLVIESATGAVLSRKEGGSWRDVG